MSKGLIRTYIFVNFVSFKEFFKELKWELKLSQFMRILVNWVGDRQMKYNYNSTELNMAMNWVRILETLMKMKIVVVVVEWITWTGN